MKTELFRDLLESVREAGQIRRGVKKASRVFKYAPEDIRKIRLNMALSQSQFAHLIGVSVDTFQNWEQGRRVPEGPAKALLRIASVNPHAVLEALKAS